MVELFNTETIPKGHAGMQWSLYVVSVCDVHIAVSEILILALRLNW